MTAMDKLLFWLGLGAAQKGARSNKRTDSWYWVVSFVVGILAAAFSNPVLATEFPEFGFQFRCKIGVNINGWQCDGGGFYSKKNTPPGTAVTSTNLEDFMECCINKFSPFRKKNPDKIMLVRTKPVTRTPKGGIDIEEIVDWMLVQKKKSEEFWEDCSLNGHSFELSVVDPRKKTLVGIIVDDTGLTQMSLNWRAFPCNIP